MKLTSPTIIAEQARMNEQKQRRTRAKTFRAGGRTNRSTNGRLITKETHVNGQIGSSRNRTNERTKRSKWPLACTLKIRHTTTSTTTTTSSEEQGEMNEQKKWVFTRINERTKRRRARTDWFANGQLCSTRTRTNERTNEAIEMSPCLHAQNRIQDERTDLGTDKSARDAHERTNEWTSTLPARSKQRTYWFSNAKLYITRQTRMIRLIWERANLLYEH